MRPQTRYAKSGDVNIAYQVIGDGPIDLVYVPGFVSHVEIAWEEPMVARYIERFASFSRLVVFDKRGTGLSDRVPIDKLPTLEQRMDDVRAVMDAVGLERAALFGLSEGGPMSVLFAATYPERVSALVLYGSLARAIAGEDFEGTPPAMMHSMIQALEDEWASGPLLPLFSPSLVDDERYKEWWARALRSAASPAAAAAVMRMLADTDVRDVLPSVSVPTLVIHRKDELVAPVTHGRFLAEHIPNAKYLELPGTDHAPWVGDYVAIVDAVEEFLTGRVHEPPEPDRVLSTVLFTDICGSTERATELGDRRWRDLLESHDATIRRQLERHRGKAVKSMGDGFLATFDGPARAIRCARSLTEEVRRLGVEIRAGLHTGECEVMNGDVGGIAVHIGARVAAEAGPSEVLVSSTVKDLVAGSGIEFADRGTRALKGVPGEWRLFAVEHE